MYLKAAICLQVLLFIHLALVSHCRISLRGEGLEIFLLVITLVISLWVFMCGQPEKANRRIKRLYLLNAIGQLPLWVTAIVMMVSIYATDTIGAFNTPSGNHILLKIEANILGCSVYPYVVHGVFEQLIHQQDHTICFPFLESKILKTTWSDDETKFTVSIKNPHGLEESEDYTFKITP